MSGIRSGTFPSAHKHHVCVVARMSRSNMYNNLLSLLSKGFITLDELDDFSEDLKQRLAFFMKK